MQIFKPERNEREKKPLFGRLKIVRHTEIVQQNAFPFFLLNRKTYRLSKTYEKKELKNKDL